MNDKKKYESIIPLEDVIRNLSPARPLPLEALERLANDYGGIFSKRNTKKGIEVKIYFSNLPEDLQNLYFLQKENGLFEYLND